MTTTLAKLDADAVAFYVARYSIEKMRELQAANHFVEWESVYIDPRTTKTYANVMGLIAYARGEKQIAIPVREAVAQILCGLRMPPAPKDPRAVLPEWSLIVEPANWREMSEGAAPATSEPAVTAPEGFVVRNVSQEAWEKEGEDDDS